jgi:hypothetical protein
MLLHAPRIARSLERSVGILPNRLCKIIRHSHILFPTTIPGETKTKRQHGGTAPHCLPVGLVSRSVISRQCRPVWLSAFIYTNENAAVKSNFFGFTNVVYRQARWQFCHGSSIEGELADIS